MMEFIRSAILREVSSLKTCDKLIFATDDLPRNGHCMFFQRLFLVYVVPTAILLASGYLAEFLFPNDKTGSGQGSVTEDGVVVFAIGFIAAAVVCYYFYRRTRNWPDF